MFKRLLLINHKVDEAIFFAYDIIIYKNCILCFCQVRTMVAMATFFIVLVIPGKYQDDDDSTVSSILSGLETRSLGLNILGTT